MKIIKILICIASFVYVVYGEGQSITIPGDVLFILAFIIVSINAIRLVNKSFTDLTRYDWKIKRK